MRDEIKVGEGRIVRVRPNFVEERQGPGSSKRVIREALGEMAGAGGERPGGRISYEGVEDYDPVLRWHCRL